MFKLKRNFRVLPLALALVVIGGAAAVAQRQMSHGASSQGRPEVKIALAGVVQRGGQTLALDKVQSVNPGEILQWNITSLNEGDGAAHEYKAVGHIPAGTAFVAGSAVAEGGSNVTYSIDGGKTYSTQPIIEEKQPDGTVKRVAAPVAMYTEVRYEWTDELAAGGKLNASYKVRVK
ncbi:MAG TPA: hypothetical protein VNA19_11695 [Pyrinomonadaceae bacterium]|jgi:uncharacterized repeat protein (TIGR01451 family)|nr:hypothetical protein [Pyrinomonadaceae bacterium]